MLCVPLNLRRQTERKFPSDFVAFVAKLFLGFLRAVLRVTICGTGDAMKVKYGFGLLFLLVLFSVNGYAQDSESAAETADRLKLQLIDVQAQEEALRAHAQELDESLKPENIERSLAGVGSTRPEELRESRRRQLTIEKSGVTAQLKVLETTHQRLQTAIANAEALAYQQSARPTQMVVTTSRRGYQLLMLGGGGLLALALGSGAFLYRRKIRHRSV